MTPDEIIEDMTREFRGVKGRGRRSRPRTYVGGLLPAFCDFLTELERPRRGYADFDAFLADYPLITKGVSTLTVRTADGPKTIRPAYNRVHAFYLWDKKRLGYPRSEPYATGKWADYRHWLDSLVTFRDAQLESLRERAKEFVLNELEVVEFDPSTVRVDPPIFQQLLEEFDFRDRAKGEPTGAAFQAVVFGYIRADAPHLQIEGRKVRTGGARKKGIGDIDAWEGNRLVVTAEVKHFSVNMKTVRSFGHFAHEVRQRAALGMIVAEDFGKGVREAIAGEGLVPLSQEDLVGITRLWDPLKQRAAVNAFEWVIHHIEQNPGLINRFDRFLIEMGHKTVPVAEDEVADEE